MKRITLQYIAMTNFRGEKQRTTFFNDGITNICGDNGLGKSRHFDAFMWLLFGKDTNDRKDYNIRTIVDKEPLHHVECSVEAVFTIDGETVTLKRSFVEKWVKPRGQVEEVFKGNETETYWNDVPVTVTEYQRRINEIIKDSVFKMVTNPLFFANMKWQDQREQLFQLAGAITDAEIGAKKPEFAALLDKITGKSLADFKREISARKKRLKEDLEQIQPRIDQTHKLMPEISDFEALEKEIANYEFQITNYEKAIADKSEATKQQSEAKQAKQLEIGELKQKQQEVLFDAQTKANEDTYKESAKRREIENGIKVAESEIETLKNAIERNLKNVKILQNNYEQRLKQTKELRNQWSEENSKEYENNGVCCTCGQPLPENMKEDARKLFYDEKAKKLSEISEQGKEFANSVKFQEEEVNKLVSNDRDLQAKLKEQVQTLESLQTKLAETPPADSKIIIGDNIPEYRTLGDIIKGLESTLENETETVDTRDLQAKKSEISVKLSDAKLKLNNRDLIVKYNEEIANLEQQGKNIAQQIADIEREEYTIQSFTKTKIEECEKRINGLFSYVTFKLFDYTIGGDEYECCVPLIADIPFDTANTASKVNAGLDIINALVKFYGVSAPIFIDGRESVNSIIETDSQIINLVVTKDKELVIK